MAYARYPQLRNWKKRCEIYTQRLELEKNWKSALDAAEEIENDMEYSATLEKLETDRQVIDYLYLLETSLEYPETKNKWFCGIVRDFGPGKYAVTKRQAECFGRYFEADEETWRNHKTHCRAAGYFCTLFEWNGGRYLTIEEIKEPSLIIHSS